MRLIGAQGLARGSRGEEREEGKEMKVFHERECCQGTMRSQTKKSLRRGGELVFLNDEEKAKDLDKDGAAKTGDKVGSR